MKLKYITFGLENCDQITIEGKYVGDFVVQDIKTEIKRIACNAIDRIDSVDTFAVEIHKDANKERYQFNQTDYEDWKQMTFDRLNQYHDITSIEFELYDDNTNKNILTFGPVSVHPKYQKRGYAEKLINYTMDKAKSLGYNEIIIS